MLRMKPYSPSTRIAVRDSIDEEYLSDDIDDDVFIRDGKAVSSDFTIHTWNMKHMHELAPNLFCSRAKKRD